MIYKALFEYYNSNLALRPFTSQPQCHFCFTLLNLMACWDNYYFQDKCCYCRSSHKRTPTGSRTSVRNWSWPLTGSLYELELKRVFVKAAISRAVCLWDCPFRELWLYLISCLCAVSISKLRYSVHSKGWRVVNSRLWETVRQAFFSARPRLF